MDVGEVKRTRAEFSQPPASQKMFSLPNLPNVTAACPPLHRHWTEIQIAPCFRAHPEIQIRDSGLESSALRLWLNLAEIQIRFESWFESYPALTAYFVRAGGVIKRGSGWSCPLQKLHSFLANFPRVSPNWDKFKQQREDKKTDRQKSTVEAGLSTYHVQGDFAALLSENICMYNSCEPISESFQVCYDTKLRQHKWFEQVPIMMLC